MKIRIFFFFFQVGNVRTYLAVLDIDICGVWHLALDLRFAVMLDGKFICGLLALKHKSSIAGLEKIGKQLKPRMPIKSKRTSLERNKFISLHSLSRFYKLVFYCLSLV